MVGFRGEKTKIYDGMDPRRRTLRFLQDNTNMYMDYPENKTYLIDREDISILNYYETTLMNRCYY